MGQGEEAKASGLKNLTYYRELLVTRLRSIQCILDNLLASGFFCEEDVEIVQRTVTKTDQVGNLEVFSPFNFACIIIYHINTYVYFSL